MRAIVCMFVCLTNLAQAEISINNEQLPINSGLYDISQDLGQTVGNNLFHTFDSFNLNQGEIAQFSGSDSIQNIISRAISGEQSFINGILRSTIPNADFYFLNPYGIVFGEHAQLDLQGSFHASTADYLKLSDGGEFHARFPERDILTVAPVASFGFLTDNPAPISMTGKEQHEFITDSYEDGYYEQARLQLPENKTFSLIGGNINISGDYYYDYSYDDEGERNTLPSIFLPHGRLNLVSVQSPSEITANQYDTQITGAERYGDVKLNWIGIENNDGGLFMRGHGLLLHSVFINSVGRDNIHGQGLEMYGHGYVTLQDSTFNMHTDGKGDGGNVFIHSNTDLTLERTNIDVATTNEGQAGHMTFHSQGQILFDAATIGSKALATGNSGNIFIDNVGDMILQNQAYITSYTFGSGKPGDIYINNQGDIHLENAFIGSETLGKGHAGHLNIKATNVLLRETSGVRSISWGESNVQGGNAGNVTLQVKERLSILGNSPEQTGWTSHIVSGAESKGNARYAGHGGNISIDAKQIVLNGGGQISTSAIAAEGGNALSGGTINITAKDIVLDGVNLHGENEDGFGSGIYASSVGVGNNVGDAGNITIQAQQMLIKDGAVIESNTNNIANAGNINITVTEQLEIKGDSSAVNLYKPGNAQQDYLETHTPHDYNQSRSGIYSQSISPSSQAGRSGQIDIEASTLILGQHGTISTSTTGGQIGDNAGNIRIKVNTLNLDKQAKISSESLLKNNFGANSTALLPTGSIVEIVDPDSQKITARYILTKQDFSPLGSTPYQVDTEADINAIEAANVGDIVFVKATQQRFMSIGEGEWLLIADTQGIVDTIEEDSKRSSYFYFYDTPEEIPYNNGDLVVINTAQGQGLYTFQSDSYEYRGEVRYRGQLIQTENSLIQNAKELETLKTRYTLKQGNTATHAIEHNQYYYTGEEWVAMGETVQHDNVGILNTISNAELGFIRTSYTDSQNREIYTEQGWIPLGAKHKVETLADRDQLQANDGDLVTVNGVGQNYFYQAGEWHAQTRGSDAGQITIDAERINLFHDSQITTEAESGGGGQITLNVDNHLFLAQDSAITSTVEHGILDGGNITLQTPLFTILNQGNILAKAHEGYGGNINISTNNYLKSNDSIIDASSKFGISGQITVDAPDALINEAIANLPETFLKIDTDFQPSCESNHISHFTVIPKLGVSNQPYDWISAH